MPSRAKIAVISRVASILALLAFASGARAGVVPLALWKNATYPSGLPVGGTMGVSWGDYDADGYTDLFACFSGSLWRNNAGVSWEFAGNLSTLVPSTERRYGSSFGDYDEDGLPDIAMASRVPAWGEDRFHLLRNLGAYPDFTDVAADPSILDDQPFGNAETLCWADVDGDRDLDLFVPTYPAPLGPGNYFLDNRGPTGPAGAYRFVESSALAGLDIPAGRTRPEGAQFADVDSDGDPDLYSNGTLYQNVSTLSTPRFNALDEAASGIGLASSMDEGAMLFDYDLDGDQDLIAAYVLDGVRIWENAGDGTFFAAASTIVAQPLIGLGLGMSAADWDGDGDIDFTTRHVFRENRLIEDGTRRFTVATHSIPAWKILNATPAWADWDKDGDVDCALGNWGYGGHFYENTTYSTATPLAARRSVRVRVVRDSASVPAGLETEYGATAEIVVVGATDGYRRKMFVASSHGYLNQNEYALTFGLPPHPADLRFDVAVDFPGLPSNGLWRIDKNVNPALANISLASLQNREIQVSRCGEVRVNGIVHPPRPLATPSLTTTSVGGALPASDGSTHPTIEANPAQWIGLAFDTHNATTQVALEEIVIDAQLGAVQSCGQDAFNVALWDVTEPSQPTLVSGGALTLQTSSRNRRSYLPIGITLEPGRAYRVVARVSQYRHFTIVGGVSESAITVAGGLAYEDSSPCNGQRVAHAWAYEDRAAIALRFRPNPASAAVDPVGPSLRLRRTPSGEPLLEWADVAAPAYRVLRCDASRGACAPSPHAVSVGSAFVDGTSVAIPSPPYESLWYLVNAVNECAAGL